MKDTPGSSSGPAPGDSRGGRRARVGRCCLHALWLFPLALAAAGLVAWFTWVSSYGYQAPDGLGVIDPDREHRVFVYGTLRQPLVRRLVTGRWIDTREAILPGFVQRGLDLKARPAGRTEGEVFVVGAEALARLDRYERLGIRYERTEAMLASGERAWVYRRLPPDA